MLSSFFKSIIMIFMMMLLFMVVIIITVSVTAPIFSTSAVIAGCTFSKNVSVLVAASWATVTVVVISKSFSGAVEVLLLVAVMVVVLLVKLVAVSSSKKKGIQLPPAALMSRIAAPSVGLSYVYDFPIMWPAKASTEPSMMLPGIWCEYTLTAANKKRTHTSWCQRPWNYLYLNKICGRIHLAYDEQIIFTFLSLLVIYLRRSLDIWT